MSDDSPSWTQTKGVEMTDVHEKKMTAKEWQEAKEIKSYFAYLDERAFGRAREEIWSDLDAALGAYMSGLDDPSTKAAALEQFDAALVRLREVYREFKYDWEWWAKSPQIFRRFW
jgi:hypothetical protein